MYLMWMDEGFRQNVKEDDVLTLKQPLALQQRNPQAQVCPHQLHMV